MKRIKNLDVIVTDRVRSTREGNVFSLFTPREEGGTPARTRGGGVPQPGPMGGGYPTSYRITDGVLDTPRSVCLLRSRRRTFLFRNDLCIQCKFQLSRTG